MIQFFQYLQGIKDKEAVLKYITAMAYIENLYVDSVDTQKITEASLKGMLEKLDPHSTYATPKEVKDFKEPLDGAFDGIGVQFNILEDTLIVIQPVIKGPSEKVGVIAGDRIITVNDTAIAGVKMSKEEIMKRLRGPKGTKVKLGILRSGIKDVLYFTVTRDKIPVKSIDAVYMIRPQIGYIRIGSFGATTYSEFVEGLKELKKKGMRDIIIDLEDNGGGYLQAAVEIANEFLASNELIVYTRGRVIQRQEFRANGNGMMQDGKVVILTNEFTASAAEIVSGAIQDQDRGIIVGRRTFGKGLVQRPVDLPDGSMIRLTVAHYYTPSGRCIQKPYKKGEKEAYAHDLDNRFKRGEFTNADRSTSNCTMLSSTEDRYFTLGEGTGFIKPYKGGEYSFVGILPEEGVSPEEYIKDLVKNNEDFSKAVREAEYGEVYVTMPEFTTDYGNEGMVDVYKNMGMNLPFDQDKADLKGIFTNDSNSKVWIDKIIHKTHIEVDREGTRAAAVTAVEVDTCAAVMPVAEPVVITLDRPFVYAIVDNETGIPVFLGCMNNMQ